MCFTGDYGDGTADVYNRSFVRARKEHRCFDQCGKKIQLGEQHLRIESLYEGSWSGWRICNRCYQVRARIARHEHAENCPVYSAWPPDHWPLHEVLRDDDNGVYDEETDEYVSRYDLTRPAECVDIEALAAEISHLWDVATA